MCVASIIPLSAKKRDTRYKAFVQQYGFAAAELDALPPSELRHRVEQTILSHIDLEQWRRSGYRAAENVFQQVDEILFKTKGSLMSKRASLLRSRYEAVK